MNREKCLFDGVCLETDAPRLRTFLTGRFRVITLKRRVSGLATSMRRFIELLALIRRILQVWHPELGYGIDLDAMSLYDVIFECY